MDTENSSRNSSEYLPLQDREKFLPDVSESEFTAAPQNRMHGTEWEHDGLQYSCTESSMPYKADPGTRTRLFTIIGLVISGVFSLACIALGLYISLGCPVGVGRYEGKHLRLNIQPSAAREFYFLLLNLTFIKLAAYSITTAHHTALKWALAFEDDKHGRPRLEFNSNFRFLLSSQKTLSANGLPANVVMAFCLAVTYASSSMVLLGANGAEEGYNTVISHLPLLILGIAILIQVIICCWALWATGIPTWSESPFDTASVLVKKNRLRRVPGRCMYALYDSTFPTEAKKPREPQRSSWDSHPEFRRFVLYIWLLIAAGYYWCFIIWAMTVSGTQGAHKGMSWSLLPDDADGRMNLGWEGEAPDSGMLWGMGVLVGFQGGIITTAFTCVDLLVLLSRDESIWVDAALNGADMSPGILTMLLPNWHKLAMYVMDPTFHWVFGISVSFDAKVGLQIRYVQILYICLLGTAGNALITYVSMKRPKRRIPSTYGHLQTLVNLVDEWPSGRNLYWGEKKRSESWVCWDGHRTLEDMNARHAGTSSVKSDVTAIDMHALYGGNDRC